MPLYMTQVAYTPEAWAGMTRNPQDRSQAVGAALEKVGGRLVNLYHSFGDYDAVAIYEAPDQAAAAAFAVAVLSAGYVRAGATTQLLTPQETMEVMRKAGELDLRAPAG